MTTRRVAVAMWTVSIASGAVAVVLLVASRDAPVPDSWGFRGFTTTFAVGFSTVGLAIVLARRNLVGWLFLIAGLLSGMQDFAEEYAIYGILQRPGSVPRPELFAWFESWVWVITVALVTIGVPLVFPDGRLRSPRWRAVPIVGGALTALMVSGLALNDGPLNNAPFVANPFGVPGLLLIDVGGMSGGATFAESGPFFATYGVLFGCAVAGVVSVALRFRAARGVERQQIKWFAFGGALMAAGMIAGGYLQQYKAFQALFIVSIQIAPLCVAVAILRYRLYDIDIVINRALVYGATSALLGAGFVAVVVAGQAILRPITGGSEIAVAASTMLTVAAFQPIRQRVQGAVDRRFYRSRYDAALTLDRFAARLRDQVDIDALRGDVIDIVASTVRPAHAGLWLREGERTT